jgi:acetyl esterase/lipase
MAAVTALRVRDEGGQLLLYPVTDYHTPGTPSYEDNAEGYRLTRDTMKWFWAHYLNDEQMGLRRLGTKSSQTLRWRGVDSNFRFRDALSSPTARPWSRRLIRR